MYGMDVIFPLFIPRNDILPTNAHIVKSQFPRAAGRGMPKCRIAAYIFTPDGNNTVVY